MPSENNDPGHSKWGEIKELTELLKLQPDIESQLVHTISTIESLFSCKTKLWLSESFVSQLKTDIQQKRHIEVNELTDLMSFAVQSKDIYPQTDFNPNNSSNPSSIALPLIIRDEVVGVIQLDSYVDASFTEQDIKYLQYVGLQSSLTLDLFIQISRNIEQQNTIEQLSSMALISRSFTSNLDLENLANSVVTLIHQKYNLYKVSLFLDKIGDKRIFSRYSITSQGIEPAAIFVYKDYEDPVSWCAEHLDVLVINDTSSDGGFPPGNFELNIKSEMEIPLVSGDRFYGVLELSSDKIGTFIPTLVTAYQSLTDNISVAIRNAILYRSEQSQRLIIESLLGVVGRISADITLDEVLDHLLQELERAIPYDASAIWLYRVASNDNEEEKNATSLLLSAVHFNESNIKNLETAGQINASVINDQLLNDETRTNYLMHAYPWISEIIENKYPIIRDPRSSIDVLGGVLSFPRDYSAIGAPLWINNQIIGIIVFVTHSPAQYNRETQLIASTFANFAAIAIENTQLYTVAHDQLWVSTVLQQVAETTHAATSVSELYQSIANMLISIVGANACTLYAWDLSMGAFFPQVSEGYDAEQQERLNSWDIFRGNVPAFDQLLETGNPVIINSYNIPEETARIVFPTYDLHTELIILFPMLAHDEFVGAFLIDFTGTSLVSKNAQKQWDDTYLLIQGVSLQTAMAIENLQAIKSSEEEAYISIALLQVAQAIVSLNQLDEILGLIVRITPILVGVKRCVVFLWDNEAEVFHLTQYYGFSKNELPAAGQDFRPDEFPMLGTIFSRNQITYHRIQLKSTPSTWNEINASELHVLEYITPESDHELTIKLDDISLRDKARLLIGFPLSVKSEHLGVMLIEEEDPNKGFPSYHIREKRIEIVNGITQQAAIAIKNEQLQREALKSERMERELQLAREIQKTFLPEQLPKFIGWDLDARWQPARQVGGDFYDYLFLGGNRLGFVIADVADKGMPAALFMTLIRTLLRAAARDIDSPAEVLRQVNELLIPDAKHGMFVTIFYAVFHLDTGKVVYANAGHNPPIIKYHHSDSLVELYRTSMALGIFENIDIEEREIFLNPGDWILLYTDGVTEAFSPDEQMFSVKRLHEIVLDNKYESSKELLDKIENTVREFIDGADLSDDLTLATIFRKSS